MKKISILLIILTAGIFLFSTNINIISSSIEKNTIQVTIDEYDHIQKDGYDIISLKGEKLIGLEEGLPQLPVIKRSIAVPDNKVIKATLKDVQWEKVQGTFNIMPYQKPLYDVINYEREFIKNETFYNTDAFYPEQQLYVSDPQIMRDVKFVDIYFAPFRYNPVTGELYIIKSCIIETEIDYSKTDIISPKTHYLTEEFVDLYKTKFLNFDALKNYKPIETRIQRNKKNNTKAAEFFTEGDYLIIVGGSNLYEASKSFAAYKAKLGYTPVIHHLTNYSSSTQIRDDIRNAYTNWTIKPVYVLIIGDADSTLDPSTNFIMRCNWKDFRSLYSYGVKAGFVPNDHYMSLMDDVDYYADVFVSRFNVNNLTEFNTIVNKTIEYETNPDMTDPTWFTTYTAVAACQTGRIFDTTATQFWRNLEAYGWTDWDSLIETISPVWYPSRAEVSDSINDGQNIVLFRGHGDEGDAFGWYGGSDNGYPNFYLDPDIASVANGNEGGFIFAPTCLAANFAYPSSSTEQDTSMPDYWTHLTNQGGVGYFGASNVSLSYYNDSMALGISHAITGDVSTREFARVSVYGKNYMETYSGGSASYFELEMYLMNTLGDPACRIYTKTPLYFTVTHDSIVETGTDTLTITVTDITKAAVANALVTIYDTLEAPNIHNTALTDASGQVQFITNLTTTGTGAMNISVTKQDYISYTTAIDVVENVNIQQASVSIIPYARKIIININNTGYDYFEIYKNNKYIALTQKDYIDNNVKESTHYTYEIIGVSNDKKESIGIYKIKTLSIEPSIKLANDNLIFNDFKNIKLIDISGRTIRSFDFNKPSNGKINISNLSSGIYFVIGNNSFIEKINIIK